MEHGKLPEMRELLRVAEDSIRYGMVTDGAEQSFFILTPTDNFNLYDQEEGATYSVWSIKLLQNYWGHPLLLGNLTGACTGNEKLCSFLRERRSELPYAAPARTALYGLDYIAVGERYKFKFPIKAGLRTAMILSHMAALAEDPFLLSEAEKAVLLRARTGGVGVEERVEIYRRTVSPENINRLLAMPDHPTIKNELFTLLEEVVSC